MLGVLGNPTFARHPLAVLLVVTLLRHKELWGQGNHLGAPWTHEHRGKSAMRIQRLTIRSLTPETVLAMNRLGGKVGGAIHGHQELARQAPQVGQQALGREALKDLELHPIELTRPEWSEQVAYLIGTGNLLHAKQGASIVVPLGLLEMALVGQKRRRLGVKDAKGAPGSVSDGVSGVWPGGTMVRQGIDPSLQDALERIKVSRVCHGDLRGSQGSTTLTR